VVYGAKVKLPHSFVMTLLFSKENLRDKIKSIILATYAHSKSLSLFVLIYKTLMLIQKRMNNQTEHSIHSFVSGLIGGYLVFGSYSNVNNQIVLYLTSRIFIAVSKLIFVKYLRKDIQHSSVDDSSLASQSYPLFAALVWGLVMWLFRWERDTLQPSLQASMQYLYNDSNNWNSFRNWIWHNK